MSRRTWISAGAVTAATLLLAAWSSPAGSLPVADEQPAAPAAQPVVFHNDSRPVRPQQEADHLLLHRHLQQLMKDRRQYRNDLNAGASAERLQADREAITRNVKLARQVRLRIQESSRIDRYSRGQGPHQSIRYSR